MQANGNIRQRRVRTARYEPKHHSNPIRVTNATHSSSLGGSTKDSTMRMQPGASTSPTGDRACHAMHRTHFVGGRITPRSLQLFDGAKRVIRCTTPQAHVPEVYFRGCGRPQQASPSPPPSVMCTTHPHRFTPQNRFVERRMPQPWSRMRCHRVSSALVKTTPRCVSRAPTGTTHMNIRGNWGLGWCRKKQQDNAHV